MALFVLVLLWYTTRVDGVRNIGKVDVIKSIDLGRKEIFLSFYLSVHLKSQELFLIHPLVQHNSVPAPRQCKSTGLHTKIAYFFCFYIVLNNQKVQFTYSQGNNMQNYIIKYFSPDVVETWYLEI